MTQEKMNENLKYYQKNAERLALQYDSVAFEDVHKDWLTFIPKTGSVLDIGAGSGRDARYLASKGLKVVAVEPVLDLINYATSTSSQFDISWLQDFLPNIEEVKDLGIKFNLILLSAVWMHLSSQEKQLSIQNLAPLLKPNGKLVLTLRHGQFTDGRIAFPVSEDEVVMLGKKNGLSMVAKTESTDDQLGRADVVWQTIVLEN
ncbi:class I SAM-dependent methyltransferase [Aliiglaciecola litoralis]|uniref:Methyltransferase domain-containing protein n=1 Tax=Aliiglaciecola litoralis TaxID=582857 RepID=A0ABN1LHV3_9ALTE